MELERFPRVRLAHLPTPLEHLGRLTAYLGGPEIWIKRDDQTGLATGGNKARKLEFLLGDALARACDTVITTGGPQSNHARQTAAAAAHLGLRCILALTGDVPNEWNGNLLLDDLLGAQMRWLGALSWWELPERIADIAREEQESGYHPYVIPLGGSSAIGALGYVLAMEELASQCLDVGLEFDRIVIASSSGGTQTGMLVGAARTGFSGTITAISIGEKGVELESRLKQLIPKTSELLDLRAVAPPDRIQIIDSYLGEGYAIVAEAERTAVRLLASQEGILLGPVYTGRAFAGMVDMIRRGQIHKDERVLFWHTGDTSALFAFARELHR
jgi:L-cysteate sulfo-lyase